MIKKIKKKRNVKVKENDLTKSENFKKALYQIYFLTHFLLENLLKKKLKSNQIKSNKIKIKIKIKIKLN